MTSFKPHQLLFAASVAVVFGAFAFACGSNEDVPPTCEGAACIDGGGAESSTPEGSTSDGPLVDAPSDSPNESGDAGACKLQEAGPGEGGALKWASNFGTTGYMSPYAVASDPTSGDIIVTGEFNGSVDFGGGLVTNGGPAPEAHSGFIVKFDKAGVHKWSKTFPTGSYSQAGPVGIDASGNVVVGGGFQGNVDLGGGVLTAVGDFDIFVASFDSAGAHRWSKSFGAAGNANALLSLQIDAASNVIFGGIARGGLDLGGGALSGFYIAKFATGGSHSWSKAFPASSTTSSPRLALDLKGDVFLAGSFSGIADFGGGALTSSAPVDAFVAKYDSGGSFQWVKQYGASGGAAHVTAVATDSCGGVFITGNYFGPVDFKPGALSGTDSSKRYVFLTKLGSSGQGVWAKGFEASSTTNTNVVFDANGLAVDATGRPTITTGLGGGVGFQSKADFGGGVLTSSGDGVMVVASFDASGVYRWAHTSGSPSTATTGSGFLGISTGVLVGAFGKCATTCMTSPPGTTLVLPGKTLPAVSAADLFVWSFTP